MKTKRSFQEKLPLILAFAIPVLIMLGIFAGKEIWPFGDNCFLRTDLYHQYVAFFEDMADRVREGKSLLYAFDIGLGSNYSALFAYYLCGPLHFLAVLVPTEYMIEFITFLIVLKIGLCGWAMAWYLSKRFNTRHFGITICGICYALSGYLAAYSWNVMWLDVLWLAVIALYGLELLVKEDKPFLYCISLALAILCNYYISIMLCVFLVFYFINRMIAWSPFTGRQVLRKILNFGLFSLLAGAIAAIMVLPAAMALKGTASAGSVFPRTLTNYFSVVEMLSRHLVVVDCEIGLDHWPNIYSGVLVFLLIPLYYMNKKVSFREKIANTMLLGFLLLSFNMNMLDFMWHGFHYPNSLPCRFSFLYTFLLTTMCFEGIRKGEEVRKETLVRIMWAAIGLILILEVITDPAEIPYYACYASIAFIALYTLFAYLHKAGYLEKSTAWALILCVLIVEMGLNTAVTSVSYVRRSDFMVFNDCFDELVQQAEEGKTFTRIERQRIRTKNDGAYFGYNSASIFSSTTNKAISDFYCKVGLEGNTNAYAITGATPFMYSFLGVEYTLTDARLPRSPIYELVSSATDRKGNAHYLYHNLYTLPLGYLIPDDMAMLWKPTTSDPVKSQNSYANLTVGVANVFDKVTPSTSGGEMTYTADQAGFYYVHVTGSVRKVTATVNGEKSKVWDSLNRNYLVDFGYVEEGDVLKLVASESGSNISGTMHRLNIDNFIEYYDRITEHPLTITEFTDKTFRTRITGTVEAEKDSLLVYSIPIDNGWKATVDGQEAEIRPLADAFVGVPVTAGKHEVTISYMPEGVKPGMLISLAGLAILLILLAVSLILKASRKKAAGEGLQDGSVLPEIPENAETNAEPAVPEEAPPMNAKDRIAALHRLDEEERLREEGNSAVIFENGEAHARVISPAEMQEDEKLLSLPQEEKAADAAEAADAAAEQTLPESEKNAADPEDLPGIKEGPASKEKISEVKTEPAAEEVIPEIKAEPAAEKTIPEIRTEPAAEEVIPEIKAEPAAEEMIPEIRTEPAAEKELPELNVKQSVPEQDLSGLEDKIRQAEDILDSLFKNNP